MVVALSLHSCMRRVHRGRGVRFATTTPGEIGEAVICSRTPYLITYGNHLMDPILLPMVKPLPII